MNTHNPLASIFNAKQAVRRLNAHHMATSAGFYGSRIGGRYFRARVKDGAFQVYDFETWRTVCADDAVFHGSDGREIAL